MYASGKAASETLVALSVVTTNIYIQASGKMADAEQPKTGPCTFLFKKSTKKFCGRKRKASDSDQGDVYFLCLSVVGW